MVPLSIARTPEDAGAATDQAEFEALLRPLFLPAYRLAFGMLRNREEAEDAVQEAALNSWRHRSKLRTGADIRPWFFAIVANQCRTFRRSRWSRLLRQADPVSQSQPSADLEGDLDLRRALKRVGHDDLLALVLRYYMDFSYEEMAATLGVSEQAVRSRTHRAVRRLRLHLSQSEELVHD
jgi:RNA polymerase sigma-70 factor, ECF subfamily